MKTKLSILTIVVSISIFILLPKDKKSTSRGFNTPNFVVTRVTPSPTARPVQNVTVRTQTPGQTIVIEHVMSTSEGRIEISQDKELIGQIQIKAGEIRNLTIPLMQESKDGDTLTVTLYNKGNEQVEQHEVFITATSLTPGVPLPKDLQI